MQQAVKVEALRASPTNPRKFKEDVAFGELADSMKEHALLQPILVRALAGENVTVAGATHPVYEVVCGERRFRAALKLKWDTIPATVRDMDDAEVLACQLVENIQREDLHPLDEAEQLVRLKKLPTSVPTIARSTGRSKTYVYSRIKLLDLPRKMLKALRENQVSLDVGLEVARMPNSKHREEVSKEVLGTYEGETLNLQEVRRTIEQRYRYDLTNAPFNTEDETLHRQAGPCSTCPKRSGMSPDLFGDVKDSICLDPACYGEKIRRNYIAQIKEAEAEGATALTDAETKQLFYAGSDQLKSKYVDLEAPLPESESKKKLRTLLGDEAPSQYVALDGTGQVRHLLLRKEATAVLRSKKLMPATAQASYPGETKKQAYGRQKEEQRRRAMRHTFTVAVDRLVEAAERSVKVPAWQDLVLLLLRQTWNDTHVMVAKRRQLDTKKSPTVGMGLERFAKASTEAVCRGLAMEILACRTKPMHETSIRDLPALKVFVDHYEIDLAGIRSEYLAARNTKGKKKHKLGDGCAMPSTKLPKGKARKKKAAAR